MIDWIGSGKVMVCAWLCLVHQQHSFRWKKSETTNCAEFELCHKWGAGQKHDEERTDDWNRMYWIRWNDWRDALRKKSLWAHTRCHRQIWWTSVVRLLSSARLKRMKLMHWCSGVAGPNSIVRRRVWDQNYKRMILFRFLPRKSHRCSLCSDTKCLFNHFELSVTLSRHILQLLYLHVDNAILHSSAKFEQKVS